MCDKYVTYGMEFAFGSCVRGHHVSKEFWTPNVGELSCQREEDNPNDPYAVDGKTEAGTVPVTYRGKFQQPVYCHVWVGSW